MCRGLGASLRAIGELGALVEANWRSCGCDLKSNYPLGTDRFSRPAR